MAQSSSSSSIIPIIVGTSAVGAGVSSLIDSGSGMVNNAMSFYQNMALQHDAQQWQERMSNTAHQREVADLEAAGLNPILSATGGQGASTGSVGANSASPQAITPGANFMNMLNSSAQYDFTRSQADNMRTDSVLKGTQVLTERQKVSNMIQELYESKSREGLNRSRIREIDQNIAVMKKQLDVFDSTIALNYANQNQALMNADYLNESINKVKAETDFIRQKERWVTPENIGKGIAAGAGLYIAGRSKLFSQGARHIKNIDMTKPILKYLGH